ncbi:hypothetical protein C900_02261 [Fulvivirga imtechensis AK7]|uniref:DUF4468 domain-containing protein n=2 Tax=Fulvivirga TaxID=396811 RepID=L8JSD7_9BACT|nr:hypothetical protein C900_02261 [Fulvivirga imtechensis AK7]
MVASLDTGWSPAGIPSIQYEGIIACKGYDKATIYHEIVDYFKTHNISELKLDCVNQISGSGKLRIYNKLIGSIKNPAGEVAFDFIVDVKDEKFRYTMHNIWFTAIERDRYGRFEKSQDEPVPVDNEHFKFKSALLRKIEKQVQAHMDEVLWAIKKEIEADKLETTDW